MPRSWPGRMCRGRGLEQGPIGGGATAAGMGHIVVMDDSPAQLGADLVFAPTVARVGPATSRECRVRAVRHAVGRGG